MPHVPQLRTVAEAQAMGILPPGMRRDRIYDAARRGQLPAVRIGRQVYLDVAALEEWAAGGGTPLPGGWRREAAVGGDAP